MRRRSVCAIVLIVVLGAANVPAQKATPADLAAALSGSWKLNQELRQEFSATQRKLVKSWSIDSNKRLVLTEHVESMTVNTTESKAVFDRQ